MLSKGEAHTGRRDDPTSHWGQRRSKRPNKLHYLGSQGAGRCARMIFQVLSKRDGSTTGGLNAVESCEILFAYSYHSRLLPRSHDPVEALALRGHFFYLKNILRYNSLMNKLLVANWKSNPGKISEAVELAKSTDIENVVICPPDIFLAEVKKILKNASLGAQDVFWGNLGAYTGEVSWKELLELGVEYVIIGHSERRKYLNETDELINNKLVASLDAGLKVILCVGEPTEIRNKGINNAKNFVEQQLDKDLIGLDAAKAKNNLIIAYEPIWAIGTGTPDTPENAADMAKFIKSIVKGQVSNVPVLYGGSVNSKNAKDFLDKEEIDGALVGGASLNPEEFNKIV